jgi:hypothetical protein
VSSPDFDARVQAFFARAQTLVDQGVPFPVVAIRTALERALGAGDGVKAGYALDRAERLLRGAERQWAEVRDVIAQAEVLRTTAEELGMGVAHLDANVGNARQHIQAGPLSIELFANAQKMAKTTVSLLKRAIPERSITEARKLGISIQAAHRRGEDVKQATAEFAALMRAIRAEPSPVLVQRFAAVRHALATIPTAPAVAFPDIDDAEEILLEARILARRIHRIKRNARDAQSAARLMTHVRAALSEDRRSVSPQDEIEQLWGEVNRLTKEQQSGGSRSPAVPPAPRTPEELVRRRALSQPVVPEPVARAGNAEPQSRRRNAVRNP